MRTVRLPLPAVSALAVLAAALAVGTAAPAQASVLRSHDAAAAHRTLRVSPEIPAPAAAARSHTVGPLVNGSTTTNWSGYVAGGRAESSVSAAWVQPTVNCTNNGVAAFWVGLDGAVPGDLAVEQIGTAADCTGPQVKYFAWSELLPAAPVNFTDVVSPGDDMSASVAYTGNGYYEMVLADYTGGWREDHSYYDPGQANSSAEVIAEAPTEGGVVLPLPDFGSVGFTNALVNGGTMAAAGASVRNMIDASGAPVATVASGTTATSFVIAHGNAANVNQRPIVAFQANYDGLWSSSPGGGNYLGQPLAANTSPAIVTLPGGGYEGAFQDSSGRLELFGTALTLDTQAGMMAGTSPSIAAGSNGFFQVAFEANTGHLWYYTPTTYGSDQGYGMMAGTSPSITALPGGGFETAFQANTGALWVVGNAGNVNTQAGMMAATSPAIAAGASGTYQVAFQANTGHLWYYTPTTYGSDQSYGMMAGTSPSITALAGGGFETAFQANSGILWEVGSYYNFNTRLGMMAGTSPSIAAAPNVVFNVVFQANSGTLWIQNLATGGVNWGPGMRGGTNPAIAQ